MSSNNVSKLKVADWSDRLCRQEWANVILPILKKLGSAYGVELGALLRKIYKEVPSSRKHLMFLGIEEELARAIGDTVIDSLRVAPSQKLRDELLPFVVSADGHSFDILQSTFPWLTEWHYHQARNRNVPGNRDVTSNEKGKKKFQATMKKEQIDDIVMFCLRPDNVHNLAFGVNEYKLDGGGSFIVPDFIRLQICSRLFAKFQEEFGADHVSSSAFYKMTNFICKRDLTSFAGLDNIDVNGKRAINGLISFMAEVKMKYSEYWGSDLLGQYKKVQSDLNDSKKSLRQHLVDNVREESVFATHCINYSLIRSQSNCNCNHNHINCTTSDKFILSICFCENLLNKIVAASGVDRLEKDVYKTEVTGYVKDAIRWMAHIVRSCVQGKFRPSIMGTIKRHQAYVIIDWAMKWVSKFHREKMEEWYGKAGMHWHEAFAFYKTSEDDADVQMIITNLADLFNCIRK